MSRLLQNINLKIFCMGCRHKHAENLPTKSAHVDIATWTEWGIVNLSQKLTIFSYCVIGTIKNVITGSKGYIMLTGLQVTCLWWKQRWHKFKKKEKLDGIRQGYATYCIVSCLLFSGSTAKTISTGSIKFSFCLINWERAFSLLNFLQGNRKGLSENKITFGS